MPITIKLLKADVLTTTRAVGKVGIVGGWDSGDGGKRRVMGPRLAFESLLGLAVWLKMGLKEPFGQSSTVRADTAAPVRWVGLPLRRSG